MGGGGVVARVYRLAMPIVLAACGGAGRAEADSASEVPQAIYDLALDHPTAVFGSDRQASFELASVRTAALLSTRGAVLVDGKSSEVVEYAADGTVRGILGRRGEGPGEFIAPYALSVLPGDTVVVYDARNGRLTSYPPDRASPQIWSLPDTLFSRPPRQAWRLPGGELVTFEGDIRNSAPIKSGREGSLVGAEAVIRWIDPGAGVQDTLQSGIVADESILVGSMYLAPAFGRATYVDVSGPFTAVALPTGFEVRTFRRNDERAEASMPEAERTLAQGEVSAMRDSLRALAAEAGQPFMAGPMFADDLLPAIRPSFSDVVVGPDGRVLLREFAPLGRHANTWWILAPEGEFKGRLRLPADATILEIGSDYLLVLRRDDLDIPRVELHDVAWSTLGGG